MDTITRALDRIRHIHPDITPEALAALQGILYERTHGARLPVESPAQAAITERLRQAWDRPSRELAEILHIRAATVERVLGAFRPA